jgi:hypothetical protein
MNWIFGAYSNVYNTAMMQNREIAINVADAKLPVTKATGRVTSLFNRA